MATTPNSDASSSPDTRDIERLNLDRKRFASEHSWLSLVVKLAVPVFLAAIACAQLMMAASDSDDRRRRADREEQDRQDVAERDWSKMSREWVDFIVKIDLSLRDSDPRKRCRAVELLKLAAPSNTRMSKDEYFDRNAGVLKIDVALCSNQVELNRAIAQFASSQWDPYRVGAEAPYIRKDPNTGQLLTHTCTVLTVKGKVGEDDCALPTSTPEGANIYRVEYICSDYRCGWSYNRAAEKGYAIDYEKRSHVAIHWFRRWDGDPHQESYVLYYEKPESGVPPTRTP